jgi:hypothetical protein
MQLQKLSKIMLMVVLAAFTTNRRRRKDMRFPLSKRWIMP